MKKNVAIVQARMGSTRFPGKVMQTIQGEPLIGLLLTRLSRCRKVDEIVLATSANQENVKLVDYVRSIGFSVFLGSENDVLDRYYRAAQQHGADVVTRITGDCPLIDPEIVDQVVDRFLSTAVDYVSNTRPPTYPDGLDVEVFSFRALEQSWWEASGPCDREHVTLYIKESGQFCLMNVMNYEDWSGERWTLDEPEDFLVIEKIFKNFSPCIDFSWFSILELLKAKPTIFQENKHLVRNEGMAMGTGQKLWRRAKHVIPGGNMLLSKRPEMFLPDQWPAYFSRAKGCKVWDLDGNEYIDMSLMGVGTNILGYGNPEVDEAVIKAVRAGNLSTLNCSEEVYLAERLIELHPWADMVRFARSGGEANAIAVRIARAISGKDKVAICGYHGWHDWYLSANLGDDNNLEEHLLKGLKPKGVPWSLRGTVFTFNYNNFAELEALVKDLDIGVIKMEVSRNKEPEDNFLSRVRHLATAHGIVLIFDECTSGFRQTYGGLHKFYGVEPDMAVFGKALGNGYAITAVIGRREIMEAAQTTFISSTFWTERIGPAAALKTLEVMEHLKAWEQITETGMWIRRELQKIAEKHCLKIEHFGLPALTGFTIVSQNSLAYKTLITQEMLRKGYLSSNSVYVSTAHTPAIVEEYFEALDPVLQLVGECEKGRDVMSLLRGPVCHDGFTRLN